MPYSYVGSLEDTQSGSFRSAPISEVKSKRDVATLLHRVGFDAMSRSLLKFLPGELSSPFDDCNF